MQKTKEPKKPLQTDQTNAKIAVRFQFGSVSVLLYKKPKIAVRFLVANFNEPNQTKILLYFILY